MMIVRWLTLTFFLCLAAIVSVAHAKVAAQPMEDPGATTELSSHFAMANGEAGQICQVPFPQGCLVAQIPGMKKPWATISKGSRLVCCFDGK
jgi:hypothetical protein